MISTDVTEEDYRTEPGLRPQKLSDYIGQEKAKNTLKIFIEAARQRHDSLDHVLLYGPDWVRRRLPGLWQMRWA